MGGDCGDKGEEQVGVPYTSIRMHNRCFVGVAGRQRKPSAADIARVKESFYAAIITRMAHRGNKGRRRRRKGVIDSNLGSNVRTVERLKHKMSKAADEMLHAPFANIFFLDEPLLPVKPDIIEGSSQESQEMILSEDEAEMIAKEDKGNEGEDEGNDEEEWEDTEESEEEEVVDISKIQEKEREIFESCPLTKEARSSRTAVEQEMILYDMQCVIRLIAHSLWSKSGIYGAFHNGNPLAGKVLLKNKFNI